MSKRKQGAWTRIGLALTALAALGLGVAAFIAFDRARAPSPAALATWRAASVTHDVRIRRDEWGVPHVQGETDADAAFGLAFAHCEDDLSTIAEVALATRGALARRTGMAGTVTDYLVDWMGVWKTVAEGYATIPAPTRVVMEAYAAGVTACAADRPEGKIPGFLPLTGEDIAAGFVFRTPFFFGLDKTLKRLNEQPDDALPKGSNGVAIAPSRTTDGATRLLVNSHQPYEGPVAWYEAVVESGEGWHVAGGFFPGAPFMLHGLTPTLGWANTVNAPDLIDVYRLEINPQNQNQYRLDGVWVDLEREQAEFRVKLWGPFSWPVSREILRSKHGPVMRTPRGVFAVRYAGIGSLLYPAQLHALNKARTLADWRAALAQQGAPSINFIYADALGNIGFVHNGLFPVRDPGLDWTKILPGDRSDLIWSDYLPFEQVPQLWNPRCGMVFNSNNDPRLATACADDGLDPKALPSTLGLQSNMTNRAWRSLETFGADDQISAEDFERYKYDVAQSPRSDAAKAIAKVLAADFSADPSLRAAQDLLRTWNGESDQTNRAAAIANGVTQPINFAFVSGAASPDPIETFKDAAASLHKHYGRLDPTWGEVNRLRRGVVDLPLDGGADTLRSVWGTPQPDGRLQATAGDTLIMFVQWDREGRLSARSIHQYGSATVDPGSNHYSDQAPLFAAKKTKPVYFTDAELAPHIAEDYRPGARSAGSK